MSQFFTNFCVVYKLLVMRKPARMLMCVQGCKREMGHISAVNAPGADAAATFPSCACLVERTISIICHTCSAVRSDKVGLACAEHQEGQGDTVKACSLTADLLMVQANLRSKRCRTCSASDALRAGACTSCLA